MLFNNFVHCPPYIFLTKSVVAFLKFRQISRIFFIITAIVSSTFTSVFILWLDFVQYWTAEYCLSFSTIRFLTIFTQYLPTSAFHRPFQIHVFVWCIKFVKPPHSWSHNICINICKHDAETFVSLAYIALQYMEPFGLSIVDLNTGSGIMHGLVNVVLWTHTLISNLSS